MISSFYFLLLIYILFFNFHLTRIYAVSPQPFKPLWHTPNDFDLEGNTCASKRPSVEKSCPIFGVLSIGFSQAAVENKCQEFGFSCESGHLFIDGNCRECPIGFFLVEDNNDIFCRDELGNEEFKGLINPFDCTEDGKVTRENLGTYRPCYSSDNSPTITVPEYYIGDDLAGQLTISSCSTYQGLNKYTTTTNQIDGHVVYNFPSIRKSSSTEAFGYLLCPNIVPEKYSYATSGWLFLYGFYALGFSIILLFYIYKTIKEQVTSKSKDTEANISKTTTILNFDLTQTIKQTGYKKTFFGKLAFFFLILMTVVMVLFMIIVIFDTYGLNLFLFCRNNKEIVDACNETISNKIDPNWRSGYTCSSGCLFSWNFSNGEYSLWPYSPKAGGGENIYIVFISIWHITVAWFIFLRFFQDKLSSFFKIKCSLKEADYVNCTVDLKDPIQVENEKEKFVMKFIAFMRNSSTSLFGKPKFTKQCVVKTYDELQISFIDFQERRFIFNDSLQYFVSSQISFQHTHYEYQQKLFNGMSDKLVKERQELIGKNSIEIRIPSILYAIFEEFFNYFYFYQIFCCIILVFFIYWTMGLVILVMVLISGAIKVHIKLMGIKSIKNISDNSSKVNVKRNNEWIKVDSKELVPGDIISITPSLDTPADIVLIEGSCIMDESCLTGEPTPVPKIALSNSDKITFMKDERHKKHILLSGTYVQSCANGDIEDKTIGVVFSTGIETNKGAIIQDTLYPVPINFKFDNHWILSFFVLLIWGIIVFIINYFMVNGLIASWFYGTIIISQIISPLIPAIFVVAASKGAIRLKKRNIICSIPHRLYAAAKVKIMCFDKTGTLTQSGMYFKGIGSIEDIDKSNMESFSFKKVNNLSFSQLLFLGCCNELDFIPHLNNNDNEMMKSYKQNEMQNINVIVSDKSEKNYEQDNNVIKKVGNFVNSNFKSLLFSKQNSKSNIDVKEFDDSNDPTKSIEIETIGNILDCEMFKHSNCQVIQTGIKPIISLDGNMYKILKRFEFERSTLTMSVIVEDLQNKNIFILTKGSTEAICKVCKKETVPTNFRLYTESLSKLGFYTLAIAKKPFNELLDINTVSRESVENDLELSGVLIFQNDIKNDAENLINELKGGKIRTIMATGDNSMCAIKVARDIKMTTSEHLFLANYDNVNNKLIWTDFDSGNIIPDILAFEEQLENSKIELVLNSEAFHYLYEDDNLYNTINVYNRIPNINHSDNQKFDIKIPSTIMASHSQKNIIKNDNFENTLSINSSNITKSLNKNIFADKIFKYIRIFSRMKPSQKVNIIRLNMKLGITGMCGDGSNDAGALRASHCGIALSNNVSEISIVAPFCTSLSSLSIISDIIKEGRCILTIAISGYKSLVSYGQILVLTSLTTFYFGVVFSEFFWISWDSFINVGMAWCLLQSKPKKILLPHRPTSKLLGLETFLSLIFQILYNWITIIIVIVYLFQQYWFVCKEFDSNLIDQALWYLKGSNYEGAILGVVASYQFASTFPVNNFGFNFRQNWWKNYYLIVYYVICLLFYGHLLIFDTRFFNCLFSINCGDKSVIERLSEKGLIDANYPSTMLPGCPCSEQIVNDEYCEAEYINCTQEKYNQTYHHNIIPYFSRYVIFAIMCVNLALLFFTEGFLILGPVRKHFRKKKSNKINKSENILY